MREREIQSQFCVCGCLSTETCNKSTIRNRIPSQFSTQGLDPELQGRRATEKFSSGESILISIRDRQGTQTTEAGLLHGRHRADRNSFPQHAPLCSVFSEQRTLMVCVCACVRVCVCADKCVCVVSYRGPPSMIPNRSCPTA